MWASQINLSSDPVTFPHPSNLSASLFMHLSQSSLCHEVESIGIGTERCHRAQAQQRAAEHIWMLFVSSFKKTHIQQDNSIRGQRFPEWYFLHVDENVGDGVYSQFLLSKASRKRMERETYVNEAIKESS